MEYYAKYPSKPLLLLLILQLPLIILSNYVFMLVIQLLIVLLIFLCLIISFQVEIDDKNFIYCIRLLRWSVYTKKVESLEIKIIQFKRSGWVTKNATIKRKKGLPIRLIAFQPQRLYQELEQFAIANQIPFTKSKDYQTLERKSLREHHSGLN